MKKDGKCYCPDYTRLTDNKICEPSTCYGSDVLKINGYCGPCPKYSRKSLTDVKMCDQDKCKEREKLNSIGKCINCSSFTRGKLDSSGL